MTQATRIVFHRTGGPEVLELETVDLSAPGPEEALVRQEAIGLNFIETYQRSGLYPVQLPSGLGSEAAGIVEAVGDGVTQVSVGDRVAYYGGPLGAYASARLIAADQLIRLPDDIDTRTAAATLLKGMTVDMLVGECGKVQAGHVVLVHAAAGGVGTLLIPWLKAIGATVIAHAGSAEKAARAKASGADHALSCPFEELAAHVRDLTDGRGVDVALDGVGKASWDASLKSVAKRGLIVSYGNASGAVPAIEPLILSRNGSLFLTRPTLFDYVETRERREASANRLFAMLRSGKLSAEICQSFALADAADAHRALESRATMGSTILLP